MQKILKICYDYDVEKKILKKHIFKKLTFPFLFIWDWTKQFQFEYVLSITYAS
jgi:hypothetical protein